MEHKTEQEYEEVSWYSAKIKDTSLTLSLHLYCCPGFSQDSVNFYQKPGLITARLAHLNWPNKTGYSIPCAVMLGSGEGMGWGKLMAAWEHAGHRVVRVALCISLFVLYILLPSFLLLLFAPFAVLLNCPYPDPRVFCLFLSILLPTPAGGGAIERPCGPLLPATAKLQQQQKCGTCS